MASRIHLNPSVRLLAGLVMAVCISGLPHTALRASSTCAVWPCGESCPPSRFIRCLFLSPCKTTWPTRHFNMESKPRHSVKPMNTFSFFKDKNMFFSSYRPPEVGEVSSFCIYLFFLFWKCTFSSCRYISVLFICWDCFFFSMPISGSGLHRQP